MAMSNNECLLTKKYNYTSYQYHIIESPNAPFHLCTLMYVYVEISEE